MDREEIRNQKVASTLRYLGVIMAIFYFTLGIALILFPFIEGLSAGMRYLTGTLLLIYGIFRGYRAFRQP